MNNVSENLLSAVYPFEIFIGGMGNSEQLLIFIHHVFREHLNEQGSIQLVGLN